MIIYPLSYKLKHMALAYKHVKKLRNTSSRLGVIIYYDCISSYSNIEILFLVEIINHTAGISVNYLFDIVNNNAFFNSADLYLR